MNNIQEKIENETTTGIVKTFSQTSENFDEGYLSCLNSCYICHRQGVEMQVIDNEPMQQMMNFYSNIYIQELFQFEH